MVEREALDRLADATDRSVSGVVRRAVKLYINHFSEAEELLARSAASGRER
jgi:hypothetical protein